jgi:hypothetical protein
MLSRAGSLFSFLVVSLMFLEPSSNNFFPTFRLYNYPVRVGAESCWKIKLHSTTSRMAHEEEEEDEDVKAEEEEFGFLY